MDTRVSAHRDNKPTVYLPKNVDFLLVDDDRVHLPIVSGCFQGYLPFNEIIEKHASDFEEFQEHFRLFLADKSKKLLILVLDGNFPKDGLQQRGAYNYVLRFINAYLPKNVSGKMVGIVPFSSDKDNHITQDVLGFDNPNMIPLAGMEDKQQLTLKLVDEIVAQVNQALQGMPSS